LFAFGRKGWKFHYNDAQQLPLDILRTTSTNRDVNYNGTTGAFMRTVRDGVINGQGMIDFSHLMHADTLWQLKLRLISIS
jgi:hypothetical protein